MKAPLVLLGTLILTSSAHALINFPSSQLDLTNTLGITYDSNLNGGTHNQEDTFVSYSPRLDFIRKAGLIQLHSDLGVNFTRYFEQTQLNADDLSANLQLSLVEAIRGAYTGSLNASYIESATIAPDINQRIHSDEWTVGAQGEAQLGRRTAINGGANYSNVRRSRASNSESVGAHAQWSLRDFLRGTTARATYTFDYTHADAGPFSPISLDQTSHEITAGLTRPLFPNGATTIYADVGHRFLERSAAEKRAGLTGKGGLVLNAGISGPFLPRERFPQLKSSFGLSYSQSAAPGVNDDGQRSLQGNLELDWQARERTQVGVSISRSRTLTESNLTATPTSVEVHATQTLLYNLSANASIRYTWTTYPAPRIIAPAGTTADTFYTSSFSGGSRKDETLSATTGLTYSFARVWTAGLNYTYQDVSSSQDFGDFSRHTVNLNVSCRY